MMILYMEENEEPKNPNGDAREEAEEQTEAEESETEHTEPAPVPDAEGEDATEDLDNLADGPDFAARYHSMKEKEMKRLAKEMEARSSEAGKSKKHRAKSIIKTVLLLLLIGLSIGIMFGLGKYISGEDAKSFVTMVKGVNLYYFLAFLAVFLAFLLTESMKYSYLLKISTGKFRLKNSIKTMFLGKYYDAITPLGTGGQPFQIYYLHKRNVPAGVATAVPLVKYIVHTFVHGIFAIVLMAITPQYISNNPAVSGKLTTAMFVIAWVSFAANMLIPTLMIVFSLFPKGGKKFIVKLVAFLHKIKIVKHKYPVTKKYVYEVGEYHNAMKLLISKWWKLLPLILICAVQISLSLSLPFFVVIALGNIQPTWALLLQIWCLSMLSFYSASLVPTPGNSGASETASSFIFSTITAAGFSSVIGWVLLLWRFSTFYFFIVVGVGMSIFNMIRSAVRAKRAKRGNNAK